MSWKLLNPDNTIYVSHLGRDTDVTKLTRHFEQIGRVDECILRKKVSGEPYAFISYFLPTHAREAIFKLDRSIFLGQSCHVALYRKKPHINTKPYIMIFNLEESFAEGLLLSHVSAFCKVLDFQMIPEKGVAYFQLDDESAAKELAEKMPNFSIFGGGLTARFIGHAVPGRNTFVIDNLDTDTGLTELVELLSAFGEVEQCGIREYPPETGGVFALVGFENEVAALKAKAFLHGSLFRQRVLRANWGQALPSAKPKTDSEEHGSLFISNIHFSITQKELQELFSRYGAVKNCRLIYGPDKKSRGFGFLTYWKGESTRRALDKLDGYALKDIRISVKFNHRDKLGDLSPPPGNLAASPPRRVSSEETSDSASPAHWDVRQPASGSSPCGNSTPTDPQASLGIDSEDLLPILRQVEHLTEKLSILIAKTSLKSAN